MSHTDSEADPLVDLAQEFADRYRRGERPSLSDYAGRYPEHAERIQRIFPAMVAMERLGSAEEWSGTAAGAYRRPEPPLDRLGEYRILRELARGGMGVVYEAVQESLGRHVALKVLPFHRLVRESQLERFRREARAAARLHHSNIVPVFGVGESDGVHYYAMQYIQGQNLEVVLQEVRRLRGLPAESWGASTRPSDLGKSLARELLSGGLDRAVAVEPVATEVRAAPVVSVGSSPTIVEPAGPGSGSELAAQPEIQYIRSVARIGLQVAEALDYAHHQGVLHRDIKPANILLDTQGTAWVTDFGLAKADDSVELTNQGDIVGTLRYMAPERFGGRADRRSDVYGLGLTLYEMLTLRSAFVLERPGPADGADPPRRTAPAPPGRSEDPARPGDDRPESDGEGAGAPVCGCVGPGRGSSAFPGRPADPGAADAGLGACLAILPPESGAGRLARGGRLARRGAGGVLGGLDGPAGRRAEADRRGETGRAGRARAMRRTNSGGRTWRAPRRAGSAGDRAVGSTGWRPCGRPSRSRGRWMRRDRASTSCATRRSPAWPWPTSGRGNSRSTSRRGRVRRSSTGCSAGMRWSIGKASPPCIRSGRRGRSRGWPTSGARRGSCG